MFTPSSFVKAIFAGIIVQKAGFSVVEKYRKILRIKEHVAIVFKIYMFLLIVVISVLVRIN